MHSLNMGWRRHKILNRAYNKLSRGETICPPPPIAVDLRPCADGSVVRTALVGPTDGQTDRRTDGQIATSLNASLRRRGILTGPMANNSPPHRLFYHIRKVAFMCHLCMQHEAREAARRAGPSATAGTCLFWRVGLLWHLQCNSVVAASAELSNAARLYRLLLMHIHEWSRRKIRR